MSRTPLRTKIIELLHQHHFLAVAEMLRLLSKTGDSYNKTSVYRVIETMVAEDEICTHHFGQKEAVYELRRSQHDHFLCQNCKNIFEVPTMLRDEIELDVGIANHHHLTLYGVCRQCNENK